MFTCRECEQVINQATEICPYCGADLTAPVPGEVQQPAGKRGLMKVLLFAAVLVAGLWSVVWYVLPHPGGEAGRPAESSAVESLRDIAGALAAYAQAAGGYPESLERISDRVRAAAQQAERQGYVVQYAPGAVETDGRIHSFSLIARPSNYGYRNFYLDESGVIRATRENRGATAHDPPI